MFTRGAGCGRRVSPRAGLPMGLALSVGALYCSAKLFLVGI